jgi:hypothetical protein
MIDNVVIPLKLNSPSSSVLKNDDFFRLATAYAQRGRELAWTDPDPAPFAAL